jgi:monoamine oxidase
MHPERHHKSVRRIQVLTAGRAVGGRILTVFCKKGETNDNLGKATSEDLPETVAVKPLEATRIVRIGGKVSVAVARSGCALKQFIQPHKPIEL